MQHVIVVADESGVVAEMRIETAPRGRVRLLEESQMPFADGPGRIPEFFEVFRQEFFGQRQTVGFGPVSRRTLHAFNVITIGYSFGCCPRA